MTGGCFSPLSYSGVTCSSLVKEPPAFTRPVPLELQEEGEGFEPSRPFGLRVSSAAPSATRPTLHAVQITEEGERLELPRHSRATPVFETGALPVRLTLRIRSHRWMSRYWMTSHTSSFVRFIRMPQAGLEPAHQSFLRRSPLPLGYCGVSLRLAFRSPVLRAGLEPAPACTSSTRLCHLGYRSVAPSKVDPGGS